MLRITSSRPNASPGLIVPSSSRTVVSSWTRIGRPVSAKSWVVVVSCVISTPATVSSTYARALAVTLYVPGPSNIVYWPDALVVVVRFIGPEATTVAPAIGLQGGVVRDRPGERPGRPSRRQVDGCERVELAFAPDVVVLGGAAAGEVGRVDGGLREECARRVDVVSQAWARPTTSARRFRTRAGRPWTCP